MKSVENKTPFSFKALPLHLRSLDSPEAIRDIQAAQHVFVQQLGVVDWELLRRTMKSGAVEVQLPDLVFRSPWPFDGESGFGDDVVAAMPNAPIKHQDGTLARLREIEPEKGKRLQRYHDLDFEWAGMIDRVIETQNRFLSRIDTNTSNGAGRFIADNFATTQLFYSSTHPSAAMFEYFCKQAWVCIGLPTPYPAFSGLDGWREWSVPVHPLIARRLGLKWADERTRYRYGSLGEVTWAEWIELYVDIFG